jgi:hypothetical protein
MHAAAKSKMRAALGRGCRSEPSSLLGWVPEVGATAAAAAAAGTAAEDERLSFTEVRHSAHAPLRSEATRGRREGEDRQARVLAFDWRIARQSVKWSKGIFWEGTVHTRTSSRVVGVRGGAR